MQIFENVYLKKGFSDQNGEIVDCDENYSPDISNSFG